MPFIVMEYVEGHTVRDLLTDGAALPIDEAIEITAGVLAALEYSHRAGIVHRDIKPANVMLTPTGDVKVMDFGIARAMSDSSGAMTQTQAVVGTAQYLSPEQARGEIVDTRSDLYSTGCLLYELLTGRPPFVGDSAVERGVPARQRGAGTAVGARARRARRARPHRHEGADQGQGAAVLHRRGVPLGPGGRRGRRCRVGTPAGCQDRRARCRRRGAGARRPR